MSKKRNEWKCIKRNLSSRLKKKSSKGRTCENLGTTGMSGETPISFLAELLRGNLRSLVPEFVVAEMAGPSRRSWWALRPHTRLVTSHYLTQDAVLTMGDHDGHMIWQKYLWECCRYGRKRVMFSETAVRCGFEGCAPSWVYVIDIINICFIDTRARVA